MIIALSCGVSVFLSVIAVFTVLHAKNPKNKRNVWLFDDWCVKVYIALFGEKPPEYIAKKVGVDVSKYTHNCVLLGISEDIKPIVIYRIIGLILLFVGMICGFVFRSIYIMFVFLLISALLIYYPMKNTTSKLNKKREQMRQELPRFLDMLHTALIVGLPAETAIKKTATHLSGTILGQEFLKSLVSSQVGALSWQKALEDLAKNYEIDSLSDFVLDLVTSYNNGTSIVESVTRKSADIKHSNLLHAKEKAGKMTNIILFPVLLLKILPLVVMLAIPIISQLNDAGFGL